MDRREQITRIIEAVYDRGIPAPANSVRIELMVELANRIELEYETPPQASQIDKPAQKKR